MTRIVFWNVNNRDLTPNVCSLAAKTEADVIVLNENKVSAGRTLQALRQVVESSFFIPVPASGTRFHCFCRESSLDLSEVHSGFRISVRRFSFGSNRLLLALVHCPDIRNYDSESRLSYAHELADEFDFVKQQQSTNKLIAIGDFNMNPYDRGMNLPRGLNAMMTKACAQRGIRRHLHKGYELYYNPMWSLFGDKLPGPAGTVYDTSNQGPYGWSMLDQVILNHSVVDLFEDVTILTEAGESSLMNQHGHPDAENASDHFPILLTLREQENV